LYGKKQAPAFCRFRWSLFMVFDSFWRGFPHLVKSEERSDMAIQAVFQFALAFRVTEPPSGLPRVCGPRF
jgi:hypothetical protein